MGESLTEQRRVNEEGLRIVKFCYRGRIVYEGNGVQMTVLCEEATANYVPAAAVIRRWRALSGIIGRKEGAGGLEGLLLKGSGLTIARRRNRQARVLKRIVEFHV